MNTSPKYRADIAGNVAAIKADCVAMFRGEIQQADHFIVAHEDCTSTLGEYSQYLTDAELRACFKKAQS